MDDDDDDDDCSHHIATIHSFPARLPVCLVCRYPSASMEAPSATYHRHGRSIIMRACTTYLPECV